jgi:hypothetical protein
MKVHQILEDSDDKSFNVKLMSRLIDKAGYMVKINKNESITANLGGGCSADIFYQLHDGNWHLQAYKSAMMVLEKSNLSPEDLLTAINTACTLFVDNAA